MYLFIYFFKTSTLYDLRDGYFDIMDIMSNIFSPMHMILTHKLPDKKNKSVHVQKNCSQVILPTHISHEKKNMKPNTTVATTTMMTRDRNSLTNPISLIYEDRELKVCNFRTTCLSMYVSINL